MDIGEELLTVAAVARRVGVAPSTLRTWDRRYGLGPSEHVAGSHRRYHASDLAKLMLMRRLISTGVAPSDAAERAKVYSGLPAPEFTEHVYESREDLVKAIYSAAKIFDTTFIESELAKDLAKFRVVRSWNELISPLLFLVGQHWEETREGVEIEHLLTEIIKGVLRDSTEKIVEPLNARPVLLAAVGDELHCLALHALAAALAERKIETHFLGSRTPLTAVSNMVSRSGPPAVFLWAQLEENADNEFFRELPSVRPAPRIILGGPGWDREECAGMAIVEDLTQACIEIERSVGV